MYRCIECQKEYEIKPDFCECGSDEFEEIFLRNSFDKTNEEKRTFKERFNSRYPVLSRFIKSLDPISCIIFLICIILSILSLKYVGFKPSEEIVENVVPDSVNTVKILDIEKLWDDTPPKVEKKVEIKEEEPKKIENLTPFVQPKKVEPKQVVVNKQTLKTKAVTTVQKTATTKKVAQLTKVTQSSQTTAKTQKNTTAQTPKAQTNTQAKTQNVAPTQKTNEVIKTPNVSQQNNVQKAALEKELKDYKKGLQKLLANKINFEDIEGNGVCTVSFKISNRGELTNKTFVQMSTSEKLNEAVFYAVNTTYSYKVPPSLYKGETLKFTVNFQNEHYSVSVN